MKAQLSNIKAWLLCSVPFIMCIYPNLISWPMIGYALCWFAEGDQKRKWLAVIQNKMVWLFIGLFLIYVLRYLFSGSYAEGWQVIKVKFSLFMFPVLLV